MVKQSYFNWKVGSKVAASGAQHFRSPDWPRFLARNVPTWSRHAWAWKRGFSRGGRKNDNLLVVRYEDLVEHTRHGKELP